MNPKLILVSIALLTGTASTLTAQAATVILVRHGEKAAPDGDPDLSDAGQRRTASLAAALQRFGLTAIFVTQYKRTHQTADSTAAAQRLSVTEIKAGSDVAGHAAAVAAAIRQSPAGGAVLVVGHSNTLGPIIAALGGPSLPDLCDGEYSTMLILELPAGSAPRLLRASYGKADPGGAVDCHRTCVSSRHFSHRLRGDIGWLDPCRRGDPPPHPDVVHTPGGRSMKRAVWLAVVAIGCRPASSEAPRVVEKFYAELRSAGVSGAPTPAQLTRLAPYLSDSLQKLLTEARRLHDADQARAPNEKPSFAEGDLFSSLFEGPSRVKVEGDSGAGETHRVLAHMSYDSATPSTSWTDTAFVAPEDGRMVIQDIHYGGNWDFALKGTLRAQLNGARAGTE